MTKKDECKTQLFQLLENFFSQQDKISIAGYKDKKLYVNYDEFQYAIGITAPKVLLEATDNSKKEPAATAPISDSEKELVQDLINELMR